MEGTGGRRLIRSKEKRQDDREANEAEATELANGWRLGRHWFGGAVRNRCTKVSSSLAERSDTAQ